MKNNAKPTMGFESRRAAVRALYERGLSNHQIADTLGITIKNVRAVRWQNDNAPSCDAAKMHRRVEGRAVKIPKQTYARLKPHAAERMMPVADLIRLLVGEAAAAGLVGAILDDRQEAAE